MAQTLELINAANVQLALNPPFFEAVQTTTTTSIPSGTSWTPINFSDTAGILSDLYAGHSTSVNPSRWVAPVPGWYVVSGVVCFNTNGTGARGAVIAKNGTTYSGSAQLLSSLSADATAVATATRRVLMNGTTDYLELYARQESGGALSTAIFGDVASAISIAFFHQ